jgi:undecaprenyl-diphosphatase
MEDLIVMFCATFLIWFLFAGLGILWVVDGKIKKEQVIHALLATLLAYVLSEVFKYIFHTQRPFLTNGREVDVLFIPKDGAFPSGHAAQSFALAITVFLHDRKIGFWFVVAAILIGVARVIANVHYPIDILGGAFLGTLVAIFVEKVHLFKFLQRRKR